MSLPEVKLKIPPPSGIRWWPGMLLLVVAIAAIIWVRSQSDWPFQKRNLTTYQIIVIATMLLPVWWTFFSRAPKRLRLGGLLSVACLGLLCVSLFRLRGMTGDMNPIIELRWAQHPVPDAPSTAMSSNRIATLAAGSAANDFPQFLGPDRNGVLPSPELETNWNLRPPEIVWRQPVGAAWSGFAIVGNVAVTQEQRDDTECVVAYELSTGRQLWLHGNPGRYQTTIAGEGPRATPTIRSNRVFTLGATGILNCLDLLTGSELWSQNLIAVAGGKIPDWGFANSPLLVGELIVVHAGENAKRSLLAFDMSDGQLAWMGGAFEASYASPTLAELGGLRQILAFNDGHISAHDPVNGHTLWERPWGNGNVVCASPVVVGSNRVLFSSGYGVGAELLEVSQSEDSKLVVKRVWRSIRMKSKFGHLFIRDGFLYGLDDGIFACVDLQDGSQRWKEGRYGHGQGLLVGNLYLLMAESGELILLQPTPDAPNELGRFRVFDSKTWNPLSLSGELLLVRNDREAVCLKLTVRPNPVLDPD